MAWRQIVLLDKPGWRPQADTMFRFLILFTVFATPAAASSTCDDLWFTRNLVFDRAGYCFGSNLGQAVFDNSDCISKDVTLNNNSKNFVSSIKQLETGYGCSVDTSRRNLDLDDVSVRRRLTDLPVRDEYESGCLGWLGPVSPLHAGHGGASAIIGQIEVGDFVSFAYIPAGGWTYVITYGLDWGYPKSAGWTRTLFNDSICQDWAG